MLGRAGVLVPEVERTEVFLLKLLPAAAARSAEACDTPPSAASRWAAPRMLLAPVLGVLRPKLRDEAVDEERRWREGVGWVAPRMVGSLGSSGSREGV